VSSDFFVEPANTLLDKAFRALTVGLTLVLATVFLAAGIALAIVPNPKIGNFGNAIAADIFLTLGLTTIVGLLSALFPNGSMLSLLAEGMFRKLLMLAAVLFVAFFVVLIVT
jgi:hypothetical protein